MSIRTPPPPLPAVTAVSGSGEDRLQMVLRAGQLASQRATEISELKEATAALLESKMALDEATEMMLYDSEAGEQYALAKKLKDAHDLSVPTDVRAWSLVLGEADRAGTKAEILKLKAKIALLQRENRNTNLKIKRTGSSEKREGQLADRATKIKEMQAEIAKLKKLLE